jgi:hypothetical protein
MGNRVDNHFGAASQLYVPIDRIKELLKTANMAGPDFFGTVSSTVIVVFMDI